MLYGRPIDLLHVKQPHYAFLLYLLLQFYPPAVISPIVSGCKNLRRNTLLHADAILRDLRKTSIFRIAKIHCERHDKLVLDCEVILTIGFMDLFVVEHTRLACLVPREKFIPFPSPHLVHSIILYVGHRPYIIEVFLSIKVVGYHDLVACKSKVSGSFRSAHGRKDTLSKNNKCSIFIIIIETIRDKFGFPFNHYCPI